MHQWKKFENRLKFNKDVDNKKVGHFFGTQCTCFLFVSALVFVSCSCPVCCSTWCLTHNSCLEANTSTRCLPRSTSLQHWTCIWTLSTCLSTFRASSVVPQPHVLH